MQWRATIGTEPSVDDTSSWSGGEALLIGGMEMARGSGKEAPERGDADIDRCMGGMQSLHGREVLAHGPHMNKILGIPLNPDFDSRYRKIARKVIKP